jgi:hypothetical protein
MIVEKFEKYLMLKIIITVGDLKLIFRVTQAYFYYKSKSVF